MSKSLSHGVKTGVMTAAGVSAGLLGHTLLATLGLYILLSTSERIFTGLKVAGAAYLLDSAFLSQFMAEDATHPTSIDFVLDVLFAVLTLIIKGPVAIFSSRLSSCFQSHPAALAWLCQCSGLVMVGLAVRHALSRCVDA